MGMTDPVADMLTRIRNANLVKHKTIEVPTSKLKIEVARILKEEGFIGGYEVVGEGPASRIHIQMKYASNGERVIHGVRRISKPGCRRYASVKEIPRVLGGLGVSIVSTSRGLLSGEAAKKANIGGELLAEIW